MAAPSGTVWGGIVNDGTSKAARLGIYRSVANTSNTVCTVSVQIYIWTRYRVQDSTNSVYFSWGSTSTTNLVNSNVSVNTTNTEWSASNQILLYSTSGTYNRTTAAQTGYCAGKITGLDYIGTAVSTYTSFTIPARPYYTISYNANGGSGAPSAHGYYYGNNTTLSTTKPTRTGYTFLGWSLSSTATSASYSPGQAWSGTNAANYTLYAIWKINTYEVNYNANGGTGAPAKQTKTYGTALTLSTTVPTRTNYNFLGWAETASATTPTYAAGGSYTTNAATTLYAVWELAYTVPSITDLVVFRCDKDGNEDDYGTYANVEFGWSTCQLIGLNNVKSIKIEWKKSSASAWSNKTVSASGISGNVDAIFGDGALDVESVYDVKVTVTDDLDGSSDRTRPLSQAKFVIDFKAGGDGVGMGKPSTYSDMFECGFTGAFDRGYGGGTIADSSGYLALTLSEVKGGKKALIKEAERTGILKIVLPNDFCGSMIKFDVEIFSYTKQNIVTYSFGGQIYVNSSDGSYNWASRSWNVSGSSRQNTTNLEGLPIAFGRHNEKAAVSIGAVDTNWGYSMVVIRNVDVFYSNVTTNKWTTGWDIIVDTNELDNVVLSYNTGMYNNLNNNAFLQKKLLWSNSSHTSTFAAQSISLNLSAYDSLKDQVEVEWKGLKSATHYGFTRFAIGSYGQINFFTHVDSASDTSNPPYIFNRNVVVGTTQIDFSGCILRLTNNSTYATIQNDYIIPVRIYIVKGAK